ncbi:MAG: broad-spectrum mercury transporter MerE [Nitrospiraceae bacterium]
MKRIQRNNTKLGEVDNSTQARSPGWKGYLHMAIAALTCPCHVPIYLAILGGTALGAFLQENLLLFILALTGIFVVALRRGLQLSRAKGKADTTNTQQ